MVRKCRGVAEIAVMEVDVRTRAQADLELDVPASSSGLAKKRKISSGEFECSTASYVKLRSRRRQVILPENNSAPTAPAERILERPRTLTENGSSSPSSDDTSTFCCSRNGSSELVEEERIKFVDLEDENDEVEGVTYNSSRERRETTPSSQFRSEQSVDMESTAGKNEATSGSGHGSLSEKMPTESELEEFFIAAEKDIQKRFAEKYNYDIVEDVPLEGRYEWVRLNP